MTSAFFFSSQKELFYFYLNGCFALENLAIFFCMFRWFDFNDTFRNLSTCFKHFPNFILKYILIILWEFHICMQIYFHHLPSLLKPLRTPSLCAPLPKLYVLFKGKFESHWVQLVQTLFRALYQSMWSAF